MTTAEKKRRDHRRRYRPIVERKRERAFRRLPKDAAILLREIEASHDDKAAPGLYAWFPDELETISPHLDGEETAQAARDLEEAGYIVYDRETGLLWHKTRISEDPPASSKNVRGWRRPWMELPDSPLLEIAAQAIRIYLEAECGPAWVDAFDEITDGLGQLPDPIEEGEIDCTPVAPPDGASDRASAQADPAPDGASDGASDGAPDGASDGASDGACRAPPHALNLNLYPKIPPTPQPPPDGASDPPTPPDLARERLRELMGKPPPDTPDPRRRADRA